MVRTNIDIDEALLQRVMQRYNLRTKREAVHFALHELVGSYTKKDMLEMQGTGWDGPERADTPPVELI